MKRPMLGALPSPRDEADFPFRALMETVAKPPMPGGVRPLPNPLNQGQTGTCVAQGITGAANILFHSKVGKWLFDEKSARDLYVRATGDKTMQLGTYPRLVLKFAQKTGILGTDGLRYKIGPYHSLMAGDKQANIEQAIGLLHLPVVCAIDWPEDWMGKGSAVLPDPVGPSAGGHCFLLSDYAMKHPAPHVTTWQVDDEMLNSWGWLFGNKGRAWANAKVITTRAFDLWTFTV